MDFLDPKIERRNRIVLFLGYGLVAVAIGLITLILLYQAYGFGIDRQGKVTQAGFIFVSSQPTGATIKLNNQPYKDVTNTRVTELAGTYNLQIESPNYRTWQHQVVINGGDVQHFDYPFLFPTTLTSSSLRTLAAQPTVALQSPDKRWLLVDESNASGTFLQYDMKNPDKPTASEFALPAASYTAGDGAQSWTLVEWAADNQHILLLHTYVTAGVTNHEYVLVDRDTPDESADLTKSLNLSAGDTVNLYNARTDQYYVYDQTAQTLNRVNGSDGSQVASIPHVLTFKPYGTDRLLYVTDTPPSGKITKGQVTAVLQDGQKSTALRTLPAATSYAVNMAQYDGDWYVAVGADSSNAVYIYKNPESETILAGTNYPAAWRRLDITAPNYVSFSSNTQFIMVESGQDFVVYNADNNEVYRYHAAAPLDTPQLHATWMDGDRLYYVTGGKLMVFDYDYRNKQTLESASPAYLPFFSSNYKYIYNLQSADTTTYQIMSTPLTVTK